MFVVDQNAGPGGRSAVFTLEPESKTVRLFATSSLWRQAQDILRAVDGGFLVLDYCEEGGVGKVFELSADGARSEELAIPTGLVDPYQFERAPDGAMTITLPVAAEAWLERLLLQLGPHAGIRSIDPPLSATLGSDAAERVLARYRASTGT